MERLAQQVVKRCAGLVTERYYAQYCWGGNQVLIGESRLGLNSDLTNSDVLMSDPSILPFTRFHLLVTLASLRLYLVTSSVLSSPE